MVVPDGEHGGDERIEVRPPKVPRCAIKVSLRHGRLILHTDARCLPDIRDWAAFTRTQTVRLAFGSCSNCSKGSATLSAATISWLRVCYTCYSSRRLPVGRLGCRGVLRLGCCTLGGAPCHDFGKDGIWVKVEDAHRVTAAQSGTRFGEICRVCERPPGPSRASLHGRVLSAWPCTASSLVPALVVPRQSAR